MQSSRLPIWRDSQQLLIDVEQAVRVFPRYHKYTIGSDLRRQAIHILRTLKIRETERQQSDDF